LICSGVQFAAPALLKCATGISVPPLITAGGVNCIRLPSLRLLKPTRRLPAGSAPTAPMRSVTRRAKRSPEGSNCTAPVRPLASAGLPRSMMGVMRIVTVLVSARGGTVSVYSTPSAAVVRSVPPAGPMLALALRALSTTGAPTVAGGDGGSAGSSPPPQPESQARPTQLALASHLRSVCSMMKCS